MDNIQVKEELIEHYQRPQTSKKPENSKPISVIDLDSSDSDSDDSSSSSDEDDGLGVNGKRSRDSSGVNGGSAKKKKKKLDNLGLVLPLGFLDPLPSPRVNANANANSNSNAMTSVQGCKQFWKAGDYEGDKSGVWEKSTGGMDHVRVHPKFLHSNATSHKWVLGAFAELLDNSLDEVCNGATYVNIDMLKNKKDGSRMLLIEDNGGGMDPEKLRHCMSLGYSVKSKVADTIGQYGNGFKTSTMRLGADVIVFSRCCGKDGKRSTQSIGLLSYTFLRSTGKEDIIVPMVDYERGREWNKMIRSSAGDWNKNVQTIVQWSPFSSEADLLQQFNQMKEQGTRIVIYNLWEDDQGQLELDFDVDQHDIQIRGVNRDEKKIQMAKQFPNSRHFLTYRHSLRSYASILYLRIPPGFRMILRGKDVEHHNVVNDMMLTQEVTYRPQPGTEGVPKDTNMVAVVTMGFVKDARAHIDVQGFNVYHKNRLIKPFWRLWNAAGSDGRGVIGVLEANFVEPAHDKQGFERTTVLSRLEGRLVQMQKTYWSTYCHKIGYAPRRNKNNLDDDEESSPDYVPQTSAQSKGKFGSGSKQRPSGSGKFHSSSNQKQGRRESGTYSKTMNKIHGNGNMYSKGGKNPAKSGKVQSASEPSSPSAEDIDDDDTVQADLPKRQANGSSQKAVPSKSSFGKDGYPMVGSTPLGNGSLQKAVPSKSLFGKDTAGPTLPLENTEVEQYCASSERPRDDVNGNGCSPSSSYSQALEQLKAENHELRERLKRREEEVFGDLLRDLQEEREKCKLLETQLLASTRKIDDMNKEQESLIDIFSEERERRDIEEEHLRKKLKDASNTIHELLEKVKLLEKMRSPNSRFGR